MKIEITGRPISKKNSKRVFLMGKRPVVLPSKSFVKFEKSASEQLKKYKADFRGEICIDYEFSFKGKLETDVDNAIASINDILEKAGIIENDKNIKSGSFKIKGGCQDWKTIIKIKKV